MLWQKGKKFKVFVVLTFFLMLVFSTVLASPTDVEPLLSRMQGDWYNNSNQLVLSIDDVYINACQVVNVYNMAGGSSNGVGTFRLVESSGSRDVRIEWHLNPQGASTLIFNGQGLHR